MEKHAVETCPLCGESFVCKVNSIRNCDCSKVNLNKDELKYIKNYLDSKLGAYDCVCIKCLNQIKLSYLKFSLNNF